MECETFLGHGVYSFPYISLRNCLWQMCHGLMLTVLTITFFNENFKNLNKNEN